MKQTFERLALITAGVAATALGFVGILVPVLPGILFFGIAALCFVAASPSLQRTLHRSPRFRPYFERYHATHGLSRFERAKLAGWLSMSAAVGLITKRRPKF